MLIRSIYQVTNISSTFNAVDLSPYLQDDFLADLRIKSSQQGKDDGVPSSQCNVDTQINQGTLHSLAKVQ